MKRNSNIELFKIIGILLIIISHITNTLRSSNEYIDFSNYIINFRIPTTNYQIIILNILSYSGIIGNWIFFISSAWFLLDKKDNKKDKVINMILDVFMISIINLFLAILIVGKNINLQLIIKSLLPLTFENNWYITCYIVFYLLYPYLNIILDKINQKNHMHICLLMLFVYFGIDFIHWGGGHFYATKLVIWITIYFCIAYMKKYLVDFSQNKKKNLILALISISIHIGLLLIINHLGLLYPNLSTIITKLYSKLLQNNNIFIVFFVIGLFNVFRQIKLNNKIINYISSLSLFIYLFHENILIRTYIRPHMVNWFYLNTSYTNLIGMVFVLAIIIFIYSVIISIVYKNTFGKISKKLSKNNKF